MRRVFPNRVRTTVSPSITRVTRTFGRPYLYRDGMHNLALIEEGYAKALTIYPNAKYASLFIEAERNAEERKVGLFSGECERRREARAQARAEQKEEEERAEARRLAAKAERLRRAEARRAKRARAERREQRERAQEESYSAPSSPSGDIDCDQVNGPVPTPPGDPNNLDRDKDGKSCE
jgi:hypothetical protein